MAQTASYSMPSHALHAVSSSTLSASRADDMHLAEYIASGPMAAVCNLTQQSVEAEIEEWKELGDVIIHNLKMIKRAWLKPASKARIFHYYLPVFKWCRGQLDRHRAESAATGSPPAPLVIGMQAPQGCGKTTLVAELEELFAHCGIRAASVSLDDFYLTYAQQQQLSKDNPGNRLWEVRGNAGTHDLQLATDTLRALRSATSARSKVALPRYNKAAEQGKGDRFPRGEWPQLEGRVDVVLFEGWMLGFRPQPEAEVARVAADLAPINAVLRSYQAAMDAFVQAWLVIRVADPTWVQGWRLQAEHSQRAAGRGAMSDEEVSAFVDRYMPAYKAYLPDLYAHGPTTAKPGRLLMIEIEETRALTPEQHPAPM